MHIAWERGYTILSWCEKNLGVWCACREHLCPVNQSFSDTLDYRVDMLDYRVDTLDYRVDTPDYRVDMLDYRVDTPDYRVDCT